MECFNNLYFHFEIWWPFCAEANTEMAKNNWGSTPNLRTLPSATSVHCLIITWAHRSTLTVQSWRMVTGPLLPGTGNTCYSLRSSAPPTAAQVQWLSPNQASSWDWKSHQFSGIPCESCCKLLWGEFSNWHLPALQNWNLLTGKHSSMALCNVGKQSQNVLPVFVKFAHCFTPFSTSFLLHLCSHLPWWEVSHILIIAKMQHLYIFLSCWPASYQVEI